MANNYKDFIKEYDKAQKKKVSELAALESSLATAEARRDEAQKTTDNAALGDNDVAFTDAKIKLMEAEAKVEYYQIKLKQAKDRPMFNTSNEAKLREIASLQRSIEDAAYTNVMVPLREALSIVNEASDQITRLNEIAGELSGKGLDYFSPYFYRIAKIKGIRDELHKYGK